MGKYSETYSEMIEREKWEFANRNLSKSQRDQLNKSYKQLFRFQIAPVIVFVVVIILEAIFVPGPWMAEDPGMATMKTTALALTAGFFVIPVFPIWIVISHFVSGQLWHKYSKWYKRKGSMEELYRMFE